MNSIFVYSLGQIGIKGWLNRGLASFTGNFSFMGDLGDDSATSTGAGGAVVAVLLAVPAEDLPEDMR